MKKLITIVLVLALTAAVASAQTTTTCPPGVSPSSPYCTTSASSGASETFTSRAVDGVVLIMRPGSDEWVVLRDGELIPMGSIVDTTKGSFKLVALADSTGRTQTALFWGGIFKVTQIPDPSPKGSTARASAAIMYWITQVELMGKQPAPCSKARAARVKKGDPHLWGAGKGRFRTKANQSAATVRGTKWFVEERCDGTYTKVDHGVVEVRDYARKKTVTVRAGHTYLAPRRGRGS
jgi:hypothetical protein